MNEKAESKIIISPAQGLLILIEAALKKERSLKQYKIKSDDWTDSESFSSNDSITASPVGFFSPTKSSSTDILDQYPAMTTVSSESLIKLYVLGGRDNFECKIINNLLRSDLPGIYEVSSTDDSINRDPTRRYFETKLAVYSLQHGLTQLSLIDLNGYKNALISRLINIQSKFHDSAYLKTTVNEYTLPDMQELKQQVVNKAFFATFSDSDWEKMSLLVDCWIYGYLINICYDEKLPIDIYDDPRGLFCNPQRGRVDRNLVNLSREEPTQYSKNLGIINSLTPTPADSNVQSRQPQKGMILSDARTFVPNTRWVLYNFSHLVHPFINSISGTMLAHLRCLAEVKNISRLKRMSKLFDTGNADKLALYLRLFSALLIYGPGGHSWFEFTNPVTLTNVREAFGDIPWFDTLDMETIAYTNNLPAVNQAIQETIDYNRVILARRLTQQELIASPPQLKSIV